MACNISLYFHVLGCDVEYITANTEACKLTLILQTGAPTYLVSPVDFAQNPMSLFLSLSRYKIKDTYATPQMLDHAVAMMPAKGFTLHELKNLMITCEGRPRPDICKFVYHDFNFAFCFSITFVLVLSVTPFITRGNACSPAYHCQLGY